jgi:hypothetical protein
MLKSKKIRQAVTVGAVLLGVALVAGGAGRRGGAEVTGFVVPATQIISFQESVGMLDTRTGAIYHIEGNLDNPSVRMEWQLRVPPVTGATSGYLEIQRTTFNQRGDVFLADIVTGRTWILRRRASTNGEWMPIRVRD